MADNVLIDLVNEVHEALDAVDADHSCRVVVLTGAGKGFCAGLDLNGFGVVPGTALRHADVPVPPAGTVEQPLTGCSARHHPARRSLR